jgi:hypothetical protein
MKFLRLDLLTLLISLFILGSCKNQDNIGLGINSSNQLSGSLIDTSTIFINTVTEDSVVTGAASTSVPLAYFKDPLLGTTEANIAVNLNLPDGATSYTVPTGSIAIDSALLVLQYGRGFYGDSLASRYKVNVYQLNEQVNGQTYYSNKTWNYNSGNLLGTRSFLARPTDSVKISARESNNKDKMQTVAPQIRIPISQSFVRSILFGAPASQLVSNLAFKNAVKGLYITLDKAQSTGAGGVIMVLGQEPMATIDIFYRRTAGSTIDTAKVTLASNVHAAEVKHVYSTAVQTELSNTSTSRNVFYMQGLGGLRAKIKFPYLKNIIKNLGTDIIVNRAELIITPDPASLVPFAPAPRLNIYRYDIAHQRAPVQDIAADPRAIGFGVFGGFYTAVQKNYHFTITAYIDDLIRGKSVDYGTFLGIVDPTDAQLQLGATATSAARTFAIGSNLTSPYRIKLNIIYTRLAK